MQDPSHPTLEAAASHKVLAASLEEGVPNMFCTQCGTRNGSDAKFCKQCGIKLDRTVPLKISEEDFRLPETREERVRDLLLTAYQTYEAGDVDGAILKCEEAVELRSDSTDAHSLLSTLCEKKGDREKAISEREKVLELNPGSIADREKLDELREGNLTITPRKITAANRRSSSPLVDSPVAQAFAAIFVMLLVLGVGTAMLWSTRSNRPSAANAGTLQPGQHPNLPSGPGLPPQTVTGTQTTQQPGTANPVPGSQVATQNPAQGGTSNSSQTGNNQLALNNVPAPSNPLPHRPRVEHEEVPPLGTRPVNPASVAPQIDSQSGRLANGLPSRTGTVILPETGPDTTPGITNVATNNTAANNPPGSPTPTRTTNPAPQQGRIEIIVSPGSKTGTGTDKPAPRDNGSSLDSRSALEIARDLHNKGQYSKAVSQYKIALDGAGDGAADIHQKMALCYYRLGEKQNATTHYEQAIEAYKALIAAGKSVESAKNGIRACENGIKVCQ